MRILYYLALSGILCLTTHGQEVNLEEGLIAHFDFNGGPEDRSGNGFHGVVRGAILTSDRFGNCQNAYGFSRVAEPHVISLPRVILDQRGSFSVSLWFKTELPGVLTTAANFSRNNEYFIQITPSRTVRTTVRANPARAGQSITGSTIVTDDEWHHVVTTRNADTGVVTIYIDGVKELESNRVAAGNMFPREKLEVSNDGLHIGADQDCVGGCWDASQQFLGTLDDVWFFDRVITEDEVTALFEIDESEEFPELSLVEDVIACDTEVVLDAGTGFDSYLWSTGETSRVITVSNQGVYQVLAVFNGCEFTAEVNVSLLTVPELSVTADNTMIDCPGSNVNLTASEGFDEYIWSNGETGRVIAVDTPGSYFVRASGTCGEQTSDIVIVEGRADLVLELSASSETLNCSTESITLSASDGFEQYTWSNGATGRSIEVFTPGTFSVSATDECGDQFFSDLTIEQEILSDLFIPSAFTPNGDGKNEFFEIDARLSGSKIKIVDRWGKRVYQNDNYQNNWNAEGLEGSVYYFIVYNRCFDNPIRGWVKVVR